MSSEGSPAPAAKRSRKAEAIEETLGAMTSQLRVALSSRVSFKRLPTNLRLADDMLREMRQQAPAPQSDLDDFLVGSQQLARHMLCLDAALDSLTKESLFEMRSHGQFHGVAMATDESPPSAVRFKGLRFQVTMIYVPRFPPLDAWEGVWTPPVFTEALLADVCHCPGKTGAEVLAVLDKQLRRLGHWSQSPRELPRAAQDCLHPAPQEQHERHEEQCLLL